MNHQSKNFFEEMFEFIRNFRLYLALFKTMKILFHHEITFCLYECLLSSWSKMTNCHLFISHKKYQLIIKKSHLWGLPTMHQVIVILSWRWKIPGFFLRFLQGKLPSFSCPLFELFGILFYSRQWAAVQAQGVLGS